MVPVRRPSIVCVHHSFFDQSQDLTLLTTPNPNPNHFHRACLACGSEASILRTHAGLRQSAQADAPKTGSWRNARCRQRVGACFVSPDPGTKLGVCAAFSGRTAMTCGRLGAIAGGTWVAESVTTDGGRWRKSNETPRRGNNQPRFFGETKQMTKILFSGLVLLTATVGMGAVGCSSSEPTRTVSADDALTTFQNPTGSFSKDNASQAFSGFRSEQSESGKVSTGGAGGSSSTKSQSLKLLAHTLDAKASCAEGQTCACETSGSFVYTAEQSKAGAAAYMKFDKCVGKDGTGFTGEAILVVTSSPILGIEADSSSPVAASDKNLLLAAKGEAFDAKQSIDLEFALLHEAGYTLLAIQVPDGKIVIGVAANGNAFVKAKQGTWVCKAGKGNKGYACASQSGGEEVDVEDADASPATSSSSEEEAAPPSDGKASSSDGIGLDEAGDDSDNP